MRIITTETKVGFLIFCAIVIATYFTLRIGRCEMPWEEKGYIIYALMDSIPYLEKNASVKLAGVKIGKVSKIEFYEGQAKLTLYIKPREGKQILIPKDSLVTVLVPLLGEALVDIEQGQDLQNPIHPEEYLKSGPPTGLEQLGNQLSDMMKPISSDLSVIAKAFREALMDPEGKNRLEQIMQKLDGTLSQSKDLLEENRDNIRETMVNLRSVAEELKSIISTNKSDIQSTMSNAKQSSEKFVSITEKLENVSKQLDDLLTNRGDDIDKSMVNIRELTEKLNDILDTVDKVIDKIDEGEGTVGKLINDEELYNQLNKTIQSVDESLGSAEGMLSFAKGLHGQVGVTGEYLEQHDKFKTYFSASLGNASGYMLNIEIVENPFRYFYTDDTGILDDSDDESSFIEDRDTLFSFQVGKRLKDMRLRAGMIESSGGFGLDYFMLKDRIKFGFEGWDFNRVPDPHLKLYSDIRVYSLFLLHLGWDDMLNDDADTFLLGLGVQYP